MNRKGITRREFLKGSAATAVTAAAMGLLTACSTGETTNQTTPKPETQTALKWNEAPAKIAEDQIKETIETEVVGCWRAGRAGLFAGGCHRLNKAPMVLMIEKASYPWHRTTLAGSSWKQGCASSRCGFR